MKAKAKSVGAYLRVSTTSQNQAGQRAELEKWLAGNGIDSASVRWYVDKQTGDNMIRPGFKQLQADIFNGQIGTVVVYKLDRLSRKLRDPPAKVQRIPSGPGNSSQRGSPRKKPPRVYLE